MIPLILLKLFTFSQILQVHKFSSITIYRNGRLEIHIDFSTFV